MRAVNEALRRRWVGGLNPIEMVVALGALIGLDRVYQGAGDAIFPAGALDESCHVLTAVLLVQLLPRRVREYSFWPVIVGSFAIDVDHIPGSLGYDFLTQGTPRPYTHSLLTLAVLVICGVLWRRRRPLLLGLALGVTLHFFRDLAENSSGVSLLWPFSDHAFSYPHSVYIAAMCGTVVVASAAWFASRVRLRSAAPDRPGR